ncbi:MAG: hypothetical protein KA297_28375 [Kofleriaceae bacterium]|jgi:hypothetical protein|nr:hypothetical protein [Kofleriaceae bacterium]
MLRLTMIPALLLTLPLAVACGGDDGGGASGDGPAPGASDGGGGDALVCRPVAGYPPRAGAFDLTLEAPVTLVLDGQGPRCEQAARALLASGAGGLADAEAGFTVRTCDYDSVLDADILRLEKATFAGAPLYGPAQDVLAHVRRVGDRLTFLAGRVLPAAAAAAVPPACLDAAGVGAGLPGTTFEYLRFEACVPGATEAYTIDAADAISVEAEGWFVTAADELRRVYLAPVFVAAQHVDDALINSDAFCCTPDQNLTGCVGFQLVVDAVTGERVAQLPNCHIC